MKRYTEAHTNIHKQLNGFHATGMGLYKIEVQRTCVKSERTKLPKILLNYKPKTGKMTTKIIFKLKEARGPTL
jgi:hypothetical protein